MKERFQVACGIVLLLFGIGLGSLQRVNHAGPRGSRVVRVGQAPVTGLLVYRGCPMQGRSTQKLAQQLNPWKNRFTAPTPAQMDKAATLQAILAPGSDLKRWSNTEGATVTGYVYEVKPGGPESCNCGEKDPRYIDTHIEVTLSKTDSGPTRRVIVEVTPRWRYIMQQRGVDWSTATLRKELKGHTATFTGWLFADLEHANAAENTAPSNKRDWRATVWELHPVTGIQVQK